MKQSRGITVPRGWDLDQRQDAQQNWLSKTRLAVGERGLQFCRNYRIYWFVLAHSLQHTFHSLQKKKYNYNISYSLVWPSRFKYWTYKFVSINFGTHRTRMQQWWKYLTGESTGSDITVSQCHFARHKPHMDCPGTEPRLPRWEAGE